MMDNRRIRTLALATVALLAALSLIGATTSADTTPPQNHSQAAVEGLAAPAMFITYQGRLLDRDGNPVPDDSYSVSFAIFDDAVAGNKLWTETSDVTVSKGLFSVLLGQVNSLDAVFAGQPLWLAINVAKDGEVAPRIPISYVPYAFRAANAEKLGGSLPAAFAPASHTHSATQITADTLSTARYSAYADLGSEGYLGSLGGIAVNNGEVQPKLNADVLDDQNGVFYQNATNLIAGTLSTDRYSAYADLGAEGLLGDASGDLARNDGVIQTNLSADMLDGVHSAGFALSSHSHDPSYVNVTGDTMNGTLIVSVPSGGSHGISSGTASTASGAAGVEGRNTGAGYGVLAGSTSNHGIYAWTDSTTAGVAGVSARAGTTTGIGLNQEVGVRGDARDGIGVAGLSSSSMAIFGYSSGSRGVEAEGYDFGVFAYAFAPSSIASYGLYSRNDNSTNGYAGYFQGRVHVNGNLSASGSKPFRIDHPLDPANKYLYHFAVESPEVRNLYEGTVALDANGEATVILPDYFNALNADTGFNYQLTCIGGYAPVYVAEEISGNQFKIAGGKPGLKVSWQVTAIRDDPYLRDHPIQAEEEKTAGERGKYQYPQGYGKPESMATDYHSPEAPAGSVGGTQPVAP
jgi:hypothetical protein